MVRATRAESDLGRPTTATTTTTTTTTATASIPYIPSVPRLWTVVPVYNPGPALIAWYPTACLACHMIGKEVNASEFFSPLLKHLAIITAIYSACRALDAILDPDPDELEYRTSSRAIILALGYPCWALATVALIYSLQSPSDLILWLPTWIFSSLSIITKHLPLLKHVSVSLATTSVLLPAWSLTSLPINENLFLLVAFTLFWTLYVSILHTAMAPPSSTSFSHYNYTSTSPVTHASITLLALFQLTTLSIFTYGTGHSPHFWILGVGGWAVNNVWHMRDLGSVEWLWNERAGRVAIGRNIGLGAWLAGAEVVELWLGGLLVS
ncbi:hypothetical protein MBM_03561 [Drepanopeziza brunnea f. sp. 'multigermtubi' MB_m1]|uniref:UbiA prenyltransferase n=1 Tax=Marssonina brunnea f. sp. multigermtubi (strain MB_m1) TaxID=1072389 RepID=K1XCS9_MARBU|nr:uncharacterized protein MBM_03561 [Drepanopeziza brunnea f. sp. 'multigermtubi' MB_m1]EKD18568.1 hypothetical protein MBM_03561 [Drepanopeziza brunnea f. sp. 'multigermtubi' MB_m1]